MSKGLIMVVDDDPAIRKNYDKILSGAGYSVMAVKGGDDCLAILPRSIPRILILDAMMDEMDGIETCRRAREIIGDRVPILFVTAAEGIDVVRRCLDAGGDDFLVKTTGPQRLIERVNRLMAADKGVLHRRRLRAAAEVRATVAERSA